MPSTSVPQEHLMAAAAHTPGGYGGVPQSVGQEFNQADALKNAMRDHIMRNRPPFKKHPPVSKLPNT